MLYFKALFDGIDEMPAADPAIRAELERRASQEGWPTLHAELATVDPIAAARIAPRDAQRIQRALESHRVTGVPISQRQTRSRAAEHAPLIALEPRERGWLHARIAQRFAAMLDTGFVDEVRALRARGDLHPDLPSMRSVGYRQAWAALDDGLHRPAGGDRYGRDPPAREAPADLAAQHAAAALSSPATMPTRSRRSCARHGPSPSASIREHVLGSADERARVRGLAKRYGDAVVFSDVDLRSNAASSSRWSASRASASRPC
jgi:hypothetical protein